MREQTKEIRLEGIIRAERYDPSAEGKQFLGAILKGSDGMEWVIDYEEQSPFHALAGHRVVISGEPYKPAGQQQHLIRSGRGEKLGHFRVSRMQLVEVAVHADLEEVGPGQHLRGRFEHSTSHLGSDDARDSTLSFVTEEGDAFLVANDPAGMIIGPSVEVLAYAVRPSPSIPGPQEQHLWIICPYSAADLWKWRERHS